MKAALLLFLTVVFALGALAYPPPSLDGRNPYNKLHKQEDFFEFDILLAPGQLDALRNGLPDASARWPKDASGTVYVPIEYHDAKSDPNSAFDAIEKAKIQLATDEFTWKTNGCIKFVERTTEVDYIKMTNDAYKSCHSNLGRVGGANVLNLPPQCVDDPSSILHEMMHTLGFTHMQNTHDRDDYVTINWTNIADYCHPNFYIDKSSTAFGEPYDYASVVHYHRNSCAYDFDKFAIVTKDASMQMVIGMATNLSDIDVRKLKKMYECTWADLDIDDPPNSGDGSLVDDERPIAYGTDGHNLP